MERIKQAEKEIKDKLHEQLNFLEVSAERFDDGDTSEHVRLSSAIRIIMHNAGSNHALLHQLKMEEEVDFFDSSLGRGTVIGPTEALVMKSITSEGASYIAPLDDFPPSYTWKTASYSDYWTRVIFEDGDSNKFSRMELVIAVANTDGGAHVDPDLKKDYVALT